jgi:hypothetical protein
MARLLITWELGGGFGHIVRMRPLAERLCAHGDEVFVATKDVPRTSAALESLPVRCLQAPLSGCPSLRYIRRPVTLAHILHNAGFDDVDRLAVAAEQWKAIYRDLRPDLIIFDHSPTALLAARAHPAKTAVVGTGFSVPPDDSPLTNLRPWVQSDAEELKRDERRILDVMNRVTTRSNGQVFDRVTQLYHDVDRIFLTTFHELDHYPDRKCARYYGVWSELGRAAPEWPGGNVKRIFAYLKPFPGLNALLHVLQRDDWSTIIFVDDRSVLPLGSECRSLRFETQPLDLEAVAKDCDLAILNGTHGATAKFLLHGKPILQIPIYLEQVLLTNTSIRIGASLGATNNRPEFFEERIARLLADSKYKLAAERFASNYANFQPTQAIAEISDELHHVLHDAP